MFKAKIVALFLVPTAVAYSLVAGLLYRGLAGPIVDVRAVMTTAVLSLACSLAQDIIPRSFKEAAVFWKMTQRIPGYRAFARLRTDRYDLSRISNHEELTALSGDEQQRVFYQVYKKHREDPTVSQYNFRYCAWRDAASLTLILALLTMPFAYAVSVSVGVPFELKPALLLTGSALLAYLLTAFAARQAANALVGQVLSCETAEQPHGINC